MNFLTFGDLPPPHHIPRQRYELGKKGWTDRQMVMYGYRTISKQTDTDKQTQPVSQTERQTDQRSNERGKQIDKRN